MKILIYLSAFFSVFLFSYKETEVSGQGLLPFYGGGPVSYADNSDDDDIGLLLSVLLLASRNRGNGGGCGCCGCCRCCNCGSNNIPIPYPIPFPTNNPIITRRYSRYDDDDDDDDDDKGTKDAAPARSKPEVINIVTENEDNVIASSSAKAKTKNTNNNDAAATAGSAS